MFALASLPGALDALFLRAAEVWLTDVAVVDIELGVGLGELGSEVSDWLESNRERLRIHRTLAGEEHRKSTRCWQMIGCPEDTRPMWRDADDITRVFDVLRTVEELGGDGLTLVSDHDYIRRCLQHVDAGLSVINSASVAG